MPCENYELNQAISYYCNRMQTVRYCQQQPEVSKNEECLINIIKGFSIPGGLPWHLVNEMYILINYGDEFHWVLAVVVLKERCIRFYDLMSRRRRFGPSSEIQKLAKILPTYLDMSGFLDEKVRTDWLMIKAYRDKMILKELLNKSLVACKYKYHDLVSFHKFHNAYMNCKIWIICFLKHKDCGPFVAAYTEYLSNGLQVPNDGLDFGLLRKRYVALLSTLKIHDDQSRIS
ncbi:hypothetical protein FXO37_04595 [Capsicum annuum]|nr:hypothetical protein FXO37_04595 [Capsicum annuum]